MGFLLTGKGDPFTVLIFVDHRVCEANGEVEHMISAAAGRLEKAKG